jgi:hypothetical protein
LEIILFYVLFNRRRREEEAVRAMEEARNRFSHSLKLT